MKHVFVAGLVTGDFFFFCGGSLIVYSQHNCQYDCSPLKCVLQANAVTTETNKMCRVKVMIGIAVVTSANGQDCDIFISTRSWFSVGFPEGGSYGHAHVPNWSHNTAPPCPGSPHQANVEQGENVLGQATFLPPFLHCLLACVEGGTTLYPFFGSQAQMLVAAICL